MCPDSVPGPTSETSCQQQSGRASGWGALLPATPLACGLHDTVLAAHRKPGRRRRGAVGPPAPCGWGTRSALPWSLVPPSGAVRQCSEPAPGPPSAPFKPEQGPHGSSHESDSSAHSTWGVRRRLRGRDGAWIRGEDHMLALPVASHSDTPAMQRGPQTEAPLKPPPWWGPGSSRPSECKWGHLAIQISLL